MRLAKKEIASEGGHWYDRNGNPVYEVPNKSKCGMRPATLTDARKLNLFPGATGIINLIDKPALTQYKIKNAIVSALTLPRLQDETDESYIDRIIADSVERDVRRRNNGTEIHTSIEKSFDKSKSFRPEHLDHCLWVRQILIGNDFYDTEPLVEKSFVHHRGYGCKSDYISINKSVLIDFKTTDKDLSECVLYDNHFMQLAANLWAVCETKHISFYNFTAAIIFVHEITGKCKLIKADEEELDRGWEMFCKLLEYWQETKGYKPKW